MGFEGFTELAILVRLFELTVRIHERVTAMPITIEGLQQQIQQLTDTFGQFQPVLQASLDLTGVAVAKIDELFLLVKGLGSAPTQAQLDALAASVQAAKDTLAGDVSSVLARNAAVQAELDKVAAG